MPEAVDYDENASLFSRTECKEKPKHFESMIMNDEYEMPEYSQFDYELLPVPAEKLRITLPFALVSLLAGLVSGFLYFSLGRVPALVSLGVYVALLVFISPRAGVVLALMLQVWDVILNPARTGIYLWLSPGRVLPVLFILAYLRFLISRRPSIRSVRVPMLLFFCFAFWGLTSVAYAENKIMAVEAVGKIFIQVLSLLVAVDLLSGRKTLQQLLFLIAIGGATGSLATLFGRFALRATAGQRLLLGGLGVNALADSIGLAIVATVALLVMRQSILTIPVCIFGIIAMSLVALRTGTRAVVSGVPIAIMFGLAIAYWKKVHKLFIIGLLAMGLLGGSGYWAARSGFITGALQERILAAFTGETYQTNVRMELWKDALSIYFRNPIGAGAGNEPISYAMHSTTGNLESHTAFLSVLVEYNIIGFGLFTGGFVVLGLCVLRMRDPALRCGAIMTLAYCFLIAMATSIQETRFFWQPIMLVAIMVEADFRAGWSLSDESGLVPETNSGDTYDLMEDTDC